MHNLLTFLLILHVGIVHIASTSEQQLKRPHSSVQVKRGGRRNGLSLRIPHHVGGGISPIRSPTEVYAHVAQAWEEVVLENQAGLVDAKQSHLMDVPLSPDEAYHHYRAGQEGVIDSARFLIAFSVVVSVQEGGSAIHIAAAMDNCKEIIRLIDEDAAQVDEEKLSDGTTPIHTAVSVGRVDATKCLLEAGATVDAAGKNGATALMIAAALGNLEIVKLLLKHGAVVDQPHAFAGDTAMHFAAEMGSVAVIKHLCEVGANANARKKTGGTPLHTAADTNNTASVVALLEDCSSRPNELLNGDTTPLYLAAQRGFVEVCRELVKNGADVDFVMPFGVYQKDLVVVDNSGGVKEGFYGAKNTEIGNGATALHARYILSVSAVCGCECGSGRV